LSDNNNDGFSIMIMFIFMVNNYSLLLKVNTTNTCHTHFRSHGLIRAN